MSPFEDGRQRRVNIVITGAGEVGRYLAESLSNQDHNITIIECAEELARDLDEKLDSRILRADGSTVTNLAEANVAECDLFLALTSDKNTNLMSASLARALGAKKSIARVDGAVQREEWLFDYRAHLGIDYLFSVERLAAVELAKHIRNPNRLVVEEFARGRIELQQVVVSPNAPVVGRPIGALDLPRQVRISFLQRGSVSIIPTASDVLRSGDVVTLFGDPNNLARVTALIEPESAPRSDVRVVIFGGGDYGLTLAQLLEGRKHFSVRIIERDPAVCAALSARLQKTTVINGDATSLQQLKEEQIGGADFFVATSPEDEDNVMTCLQARNLGTPYCLALVHRADYADVISRNEERLGIHAAVSPRVAASRDLMRFITSDDFHVIMRLSDDVQILELVIPPGAGVHGRKVNEIAWPVGAGLVALLHEQQAVVPGGDDTLESGDTIYAIVSTAALKAFLRLMTR